MNCPILPDYDGCRSLPRSKVILPELNPRSSFPPRPSLYPTKQEYGPSLIFGVRYWSSRHWMAQNRGAAEGFLPNAAFCVVATSVAVLYNAIVDALAHE